MLWSLSHVNAFITLGQLLNLHQKIILVKAKKDGMMKISLIHDQVDLYMKVEVEVTIIVLILVIIPGMNLWVAWS